MVIQHDDGVTDATITSIGETFLLASEDLGDAGALTVHVHNNEDDFVRARYPSDANRQQQLRSSIAAGLGGEAGFRKIWIYLPNSDKNVQRELGIYHEYTHALQMAYLGKQVTGLAPLWIVEGAAYYLSTLAASKRGFASFRQSRSQSISDVNGPSVQTELRSLDSRLGTSYANLNNADYYFGFLATELLIRDAGQDAIVRTFWQELATSDYRTAFRRTFGEDLSDFYSRFEEYRASL